MKNSRFLPALLIFTSFAFSSAPGFAVDNEELNGRLDSIERNLMLLQRQVAREPSDTSAPDAGAPAGSNAQVEVRISALEEQLRKLQGKIEESEFQNRKTADALDKFQKDVDFRFTQLQPAPAAADDAAERKPLPPLEKQDIGKSANSKDLDAPLKEAADKETPKKPAEKTPLVDDKSTKAATKMEVKVKDTRDGKVEESKDPASAQQFANPREHYNYAFRLLNQNKYDDAAASFKSFLKKYPKDPLAGNASYWLGETFYMNHDFVNAADSFRQGFESSPGGPKAPDNLLKLAMSLSSLKHDKEACVVLKQVVNKFGKTSANVSHKAESEKKRIGCSND